MFDTIYYIISKNQDYDTLDIRITLNSKKHKIIRHLEFLRLFGPLFGESLFVRSLYESLFVIDLFGPSLCNAFKQQQKGNQN